MPELLEKVEKALNAIRPYLKADGGNVKILKIDDSKNLVLELVGSCGSCPMSAMTMQAGIEEAVKREVPEIKSVHAINITAQDDPKATLPFSNLKSYKMELFKINEVAAAAGIKTSRLYGWISRFPKLHESKDVKARSAELRPYLNRKFTKEEKDSVVKMSMLYKSKRYTLQGAYEQVFN